MNLDYRKATQIVNFFTRNDENQQSSKLKVLKLIWMADRYHLRKYGRPIIGDDYYAMKHGPVASFVLTMINGSRDVLGDDIYEYFNDNLKLDGYKLKSINKVYDKVFSKSEIEALNFVLENYLQFQAYKLRDLSHKYPEWSKHEASIKNGTIGSIGMDYVDFFSDPPESSVPDDHFKLNKELIDINKDLFSTKIVV